ARRRGDRAAAAGAAAARAPRLRDRGVVVLDDHRRRRRGRRRRGGADRGREPRGRDAHHAPQPPPHRPGGAAMRRPAAPAAPAGPLAACAPKPLTEAIVIVDADARTRSLTGRMRFDVRGGPGRDPTGWPTPMTTMLPLTQPLEFGVIPENDDASRGFEATAT